MEGTGKHIFITHDYGFLSGTKKVNITELLSSQYF